MSVHQCSFYTTQFAVLRRGTVYFVEVLRAEEEICSDIKKFCVFSLFLHLLKANTLNNTLSGSQQARESQNKHEHEREEGGQTSEPALHPRCQVLSSSGWGSQECGGGGGAATEKMILNRQGASSSRCLAWA